MSGQNSNPYRIRPSEGYNSGNLKGKSVVVTGGCSGLGEEFVRRFVEYGAFVTIGDLNADAGAKMVSELGEDKVAFSQCNVLTWSDQVNLFKTAVAKSPNKCVEIVVANAGISGQDSVWRDDAGPNDDPIEPDLSILKTNLLGVMYTAKLAVHYLARNPSGSDRCLIMTASLAGYLDQPGSPQYCSSKWGVRGIMRSMRRTMPGMGMRVNIIAPWFIKTNIISDEVEDRLKERGIDFAEKGDAAAAVLHMSSDREVNGRCCVILPRNMAPQGYIDLGEDENADDSVFESLQKKVNNASHRIGTK